MNLFLHKQLLYVNADYRLGKVGYRYCLILWPGQSFETLHYFHLYYTDVAHTVVFQIDIRKT